MTRIHIQQIQPDWYVARAFGTRWAAFGSNPKALRRLARDYFANLGRPVSVTTSAGPLRFPTLAAAPARWPRSQLRPL